MSEQYMAFAGAIFLLMVSPGPMVTQVMLDARRGCQLQSQADPL